MRRAGHQQWSHEMPQGMGALALELTSAKARCVHAPRATCWCASSLFLSALHCSKASCAHAHAISASLACRNLPTETSLTKKACR